MSLAGIRMDDTRTGLTVVVTSADEDRGTGYEIVYTLPEGSGDRAFPPHWHRNWTERFEILEGSASYRVGREARSLGKGDIVELPVGVTHIHPWNSGAGSLTVRQTSTLLDPSPAAVRDTILSVAMLLWLSRQGQVDRNGMPSLLRAAPILRRMQKAGGYLPGLPARVQELIGDLLAGIAERRGYTAFDARCLSIGSALEASR